MLKHIKSLRKITFLLLTFLMLSAGVFRAPQAFAQAACATTTTPATTYGQVTQSASVASAGTYRVWSRLKAPSTTNNSYYLQIDNGCAFVVGDATSMTANTWTWVAYQNGDTAAYIDVALTAGTHTLTYTGKEADVQLDRVLLVSDTACVPTGTGDNCTSTQPTAPTTSITAPTSGTSVVAGSTVTITANAADAVGVTKVEYYVDGVLVATDTATPYSYAWNTANVTPGSHSLTTRAYNGAGLTTTSATVAITVTAPTPVTIPYRVNAGGPAFTDDTGAAWVADAYSTGGATASRGSTLAIAGTTNDTLYQTEHYGMTSYNIPVANGTYKYRLHFADTYSGCAVAGCRVMDVKAEAATILTGFDIVKEAGANTAVIKEGLITVSDGNATFGFTGVTGSAEINGIELLAADLTNPTVSLTTPANNATVNAGATVTLNATANDNVGVTRVEFYRGAVLMGTDTTSPYSYDWNTTGMAASAQVLTAKAYDAAGNVQASAAVNVTVASQIVAGPGDADSDNRVNGIDYSILTDHYGENYPPSDFNKDGIVGAADLAVLLAHWTW